MIWQILIASVYARHQSLCGLLASLDAQAEPYRGAVTVLVDRDDCAQPVGVKRTRLVEASDAAWVCFIDDDDRVADDYVARVMLAIDDAGDFVDCVGFRLAYTVGGKPRKPAVHSLRYHAWGENPFHYERTPNHLNPMRREAALAGLPFPDGFGEDHAFSERVLASGLLQRETFLDGDPLYEYRYSNTGSLFAAGPRRVGFRPELPGYRHVRELA